MIALIVAMAENRVIGKNNDLIWHLPADLKHFKNLTTGHPIIMGRKTFESIGKPLPNRTSVVVTHQQDYQPEGCVVVHSLEEAIERAQELGQEVYIIGGAQIYRQSLPLADTIFLTEVHHSFEGDTFFPEFGAEWQEVSREVHQPDEKNKYPYSFVKLKRKN